MNKFLLILLVGILFSQSSFAKTPASIEKVVKSSFSGVTTVDAKQLILTKEQHAKIQKSAKTAVRTKIYRYYKFKSGSKLVGYGILISRKIRTKNATILYAFDMNGKLKFSEIMGFGEPPEFIPNKQWMSQFKERPKTAALTMGKDIPTISGSTLSARCVSDSARIARAIFKIVLKK
ncbi:hypothetical protein MNB_SV-5-533 [hydrothermal vent metagenome]|uniref:FMN-binding domain-containing protein n=1 Tax=hydrothermal vent metagenome TaxID=652676 RepID=A0A1W1EC06_9ZZZZ